MMPRKGRSRRESAYPQGMHTHRPNSVPKNVYDSVSDLVQKIAVFS